jgi:hypothetical protein
VISDSGGSVRYRSTIRGAWGLTKRRWRAWRSRIRRDRAGLALVVLLSLAVFEPLLCVVHCQFWIPFALHNYFAHQHQHHHMHGQMASAAAAPAPASTVNAVLGQSSAPDAGCALHMSSSPGSPLPLPPSPVHELLLTLLLPIFISLLAVAYWVAPPTSPPRVFISPPLRPPIPIAG